MVDANAHTTFVAMEVVDTVRTRFAACGARNHEVVHAHGKGCVALTSRSLGKPVDNRPFTLLLGSTRVESRSRTTLIAFRGLKAQAQPGAEIVQCGEPLARGPYRTHG
jgi:hypothetical protein